MQRGPSFTCGERCLYEEHDHHKGSLCGVFQHLLAENKYNNNINFISVYYLKIDQII